MSKIIQDDEGNQLEDQEDIAKVVETFYKSQFTKQADCEDYNILEKLPSVVPTAMNEEMQTLPTLEKEKEVVTGINKDSAAGSDGMTCAFSQEAWDIIKDDVYNMVRAFFSGEEFPRFVTHTNLVLLLKKLMVNTFSDLRPIKLSNFVNKVFSGIIYERIKKLLPLIVSQEQAGFVQGGAPQKTFLWYKRQQQK